MEGTLNDRFKIPFVIDTGYSGDLGLPYATAERAQFEYDRSGFTKNYLNRYGNVINAIAAKLTLGTCTIEKPKVSFSIPAEPDTDSSVGVIGYRFLHNFKRITFDARHRQLILERAEP